MAMEFILDILLGVQLWDLKVLGVPGIRLPLPKLTLERSSIIYQQCLEQNSEMKQYAS